ncbi:MAG: phage tail protein [Myxococcota bacterium]
MPRFSDSKKRDPFRNFNFRIWIGGKEVAACHKMSKLSASVEVVKFRAGSDQSSVSELLPGRTAYDPVTLEGGVTNDPTFQAWATTLVRNRWDTKGREKEPNFRQDVDIRVYDVDNKTVVKFYTLHNAWVSKYTALSDLAGDANEVILESIEIQHEGFESKNPV